MPGTSALRFQQARIALLACSICPAPALAAIIAPQDFTIRSIDIVTNDAEVTARRYAKVLGVRHWQLSNEAVQVATFPNGSKRVRTLRLKLMSASMGAFDVRLVQPVTSGGPFSAFLATRQTPAAYSFALGPLFDAAGFKRRLKARHYPILMQVQFANRSVETFMDTRDRLGTVFSFRNDGDVVARAGSAVDFDEGPPAFTGLPQAKQLAMVVQQPRRATAAFEEIFGLPFRKFEVNPIANAIVRDKPIAPPPRLDVYLANLKGLSLEYVSPVDGTSAHMLFLRKNGNGLHHIILDARGNVDAAEAEFRSVGYIVDMSGSILQGSARFDYLYTLPDLGLDIELTGPEKRTEQAPATATGKSGP